MKRDEVIGGLFLITICVILIIGCTYLAITTYSSNHYCDIHTDCGGEEYPIGMLLGFFGVIAGIALLCDGIRGVQEGKETEK